MLTSDRESRRLTVLQGKFAAYLSWSQPFIHNLVSRLGENVENVIVCNRTENLDRYPVKDVARFPVRYLVEPRLALLAAAHLKRNWNPDLMHAHFGWSGLRMLLLKQILRIPLVVTFGGRDVAVQMKLPHFDRLYRVLLEATDQFVCVSQDLRDRLAEAGADPDRIRVIYRGTDLEEFGFVDRSRRDPAEPIRVLMVGRLVEKKGHRHAFDAIGSLVGEGLDVRLTVVGEGEEYHDLQRLRRRLGLRRQIELLGSTDHEGVRERMRGADLLLHCSVTPESGDTEGIPNVVVEAQATGLPVVATRHGGLVEAVRDGETGLLVPERDVSALADALRRLVLQGEERLAMGRAARAFVEQNFNLERQVQEHLAIYEKLVADCAGDPEWKTRSWIPDDFSEMVRMTIRAREEFSIAELFERLIWARRYDDDFAEREDEESTLERLYGLKRFIPQWIKYPLKLVLGKVLVKAIEARHRSRTGDELEGLEKVDRKVLGYFREGGQLEVADHRWGVVDSLLKWHPRVGQGAEADELGASRRRKGS